MDGRPGTRPQGEPPMLRLVGVEVGPPCAPYLAVPALAVARGTVLAVTGPNGAGKSTLLRAAALLPPPDRGEVWIGGEWATKHNVGRLRRRVGMVLQAPLLFDVGVLANAASGLRFRGVGRREAEARALDWLERFGVDHLARRGVRGLSGGEAQRVSLARTFATEPELLLLDEPFAALDAPTRAALVPELAARLREAGTTAVLATHDAAEVARLADGVLVLRGGRPARLAASTDVALGHAGVSQAPEFLDWQAGIET